MAATYRYIEQNKRRTWLIALLFPVVFGLWCYLGILAFNYLTLHERTAIGSRVISWPSIWDHTNEYAIHVIPVITAAALLWIVISYFTGDALLLRNASAHEIAREDNPQLYRLVENLCITRGLPLPRIYIIADASLNAFATGRKPENATIAVTSGLLEKLDKAELEGVLAHELGHVENRDITLMLIAIAGVSFFAIVGEFLLRTAARTRVGSGRNNGGQVKLAILLLGLLFLIFGYVIAPLLRLAMSREREYLADASAALTTRNPGALADALEKISKDSRVEALDDHPSMAAMCIEQPGEKASGLFSRLSGLYATHPPIEERIRRLREMDGQSAFVDYP